VDTNSCEVVVTYSKVSHIGEEDGALDDLGQRRSSLLQDGLHVLAALLGLLADGALDKGAIRSQGNLAGTVNGIRGLDGLGLPGFEWLVGSELGAGEQCSCALT
jgi:hypothetical protein